MALADVSVVPPSALDALLTPASLVDVDADADGAPASAVPAAVAPAAGFGAGFAAGFAGAAFAGVGFAGVGLAGAGFACCADTDDIMPGSAIADAISVAKKAFLIVVLIRLFSLLAGGLRRPTGVVEDLAKLLI